MKHFLFTKKLAATVTLGIFLTGIPYYIARAGAPTSLVVTEIGVKETAENEWVEIFNPTSSAIDTTGWKFFEEGTNHGLTVFRGSATIAAGEYAIIANKADLISQKYPEYTGTIFDSSWGSLKEDGEEIGLKDATGNGVENFIYPAFVGSSVSLERIDVNTSSSEATNWAPHPDLHSLGKANENSIPVDPIEPEVTEQTNVEGENYENADVTQTEPDENASSEVTPPPPSLSPAQTPPPSLAPPPPSPPAIFVPSLPVNAAPKAIIQVQSGELIAQNSTTVNFDGRASFDPNGDKITFKWDMGDGTTEITANPSPHKYGKPGSYVVTLTVTDAAGLTDTAKEQIHVLNAGETLSKNSEITSESTTEIKSSTPKKPSTKATQVPAAIDLPAFGINVTGYISFEPTTDGSMQMNFSSGTVKKSAKNSTAKTKTNATPKDENELISSKESFSKKSSTQSDGDLSDQIQITEIFPKPGKNSDVEEWIELYNPGTEAINLGNWTLQDSSKKKPYTFPDTLGIAANSYLVLPKSITKIALNDDKESLFLKDFNGTIIDSAKYQGAQAEKSTALLAVMANGEIKEESWQWTLDITPGRQNPSLSFIEGIVESGRNGKITVRSTDKTAKEISLDPDILDPAFASLLMTEGSSVKLLASEGDAGEYELTSLGEVHPAEQKPKDSSAETWLLVTGISGMGLLNAPRVWEFLKPFFEKIKS